MAYKSCIAIKSTKEKGKGKFIERESTFFVGE